MNRRRVLTLLALLLVGCSQREPTATFSLSSCKVVPTDETRERRIQTTCALRSGSANPYNAAKVCLMWNHANITERRQVITCARDEWRRE